MPIREPVPSNKAFEAARQACNFVSARAIKVNEKSLADVRAILRAHLPVRVYVLSANSVIEHNTLESAKPVAWRFFIMRGKRPIAATETTLEDHKEGPRWAHTSYDPRIRAYFNSIQRIRRDPRYARGNFEMRFLRIPGLDFNGLLWLRPASSGEDRVIPMTANLLLRPGWPYTVDKLFAKLRDRATSRMTSTPVAPVKRRPTRKRKTGP
jgi:hypothetical protein